MPAAAISGRADASDCLCFNLRKATRSVTRFYDAALRPSGLRATQFTVLNGVHHLGPAGITRIARGTVIDRTTLTRSLALLERAGLVRVVPSADGRERCYAPTARGECVLADARALWNAAQARVVDLLGPPRLDRLLGDLEVIVRTARAVHGGAQSRTRGRRRS